MGALVLTGLLLLLAGCERSPYRQFEGEVVFIWQRGDFKFSHGCVTDTDKAGITIIAVEDVNNGRVEKRFIPASEITEIKFSEREDWPPAIADNWPCN